MVADSGSDLMMLINGLNYELICILESITEGIMIMDQNGNVLKVNSAFEKLVGIPADKCLASNVKDIAELGAVAGKAFRDLYENKRDFHMIVSYGGRDIVVIGKAFLDNDGSILSASVVFRDIENFNELVYSLLRTRDMAARLTPEFMNSSNDADIVAESSAMKEVIHRAFKVAGVDSSVLLTGETGVGKEVVAKIIHKHSRRAGSSFVKINCGAIPGELLESELFGYEPGSFTGARPGGKPGLIELANRGTLFLDEIAELPFKLQSKLLRVIQEREIMRIGSTGTKKVDFRLIAATNKNLRDLTSGKVFREDLFYRINVVPIHIPPLRERKEDIVPFVAYFLHIFNTKYRLHKRITPVVIQKFLEYDWPGNVRELQNVVERLLVTSSSNLIMDGEIFKPSYPGKLPDKALPKLRKVLEKTEKEFILGVVQRYKTTREMAEAMGISQSAVVKKMHKYGIERTTFYLEP